MTAFPARVRAGLDPVVRPARRAPSPVSRLRRASYRACLLLAVLAVVAAAERSQAQSLPDRLRYVDYPALEGKTIQQILILGSNRTHDAVFLREMRLQEGLPFVSRELWLDWERLVDLGIFAHIEVDAVPSGDGVLVVVSVQERPWWFVAPILDYSLDDKKITAGYRVRLRNFQGLNRQLRSKGLVGGRDRFSLQWSTPFLGNRRQSLGVDLNIDLPRGDNEELRSNRITVVSTRFVGDYKSVRLGVTGFARVEKLSRDGTSIDGPVDELSPAIGGGLSRDTRNVRIDPTRGTLLASAVQYEWALTSNDVSFVRGAGDARVFRRRGDVILAGRVRSTLTNGEVPQYRKLGIGGDDSIRGQPDDVDRGTNVALASLELRFPIMRERRFGIPLPFVPRRISNFDLRIDGELFVDAGAAWDDTIGLRNAKVFKGFGLGLRIFLPILELARFELAFNPDLSPTIYFREGNVI